MAAAARPHPAAPSRAAAGVRPWVRTLAAHAQPHVARLLIALLLVLPWPAGADPIADAMLAQQTASGGWPKNIDYAQRVAQGAAATPATRGGADEATIDNKATTHEIAYLAAAHLREGRQAYRTAARRGVDYLLAAQYRNGGWPQKFPDHSSYHGQVTYNDDAMTRVLALLQDIVAGRGDAGRVLQASHGARARLALARGIDCVLATQVRLDGVPTGWAAQYDPVTLQPARARAYEHAALATAESVGVVRMLMREPAPDARVQAAVLSATAWLQARRLPDLATLKHADPAQPSGQDVIVVARPGASLWARFVSLDRQQPLYGNRAGEVLHDYLQVPNERRVGYAWHGTWPAQLLEVELPQWRAAHGL